jgi:hypothetical protein
MVLLGDLQEVEENVLRRARTLWLARAFGSDGLTPACAGTYSIPGAHKDSFMRTTNAVNF